MLKKFASATNVVVYTDGACTDNPGPTGSGACFFSKSLEETNDQERLKYICHSQLHLGHSTNNMGEYTAVILGLVICVLSHIEHIEIRTDSMVLVKQVEGVYKVKNQRLAELVSIMLDLKKHFRSFKIDWIRRELNAFADKVAKDAANNIVGRSAEQPDLFKIKFKDN